MRMNLYCTVIGQKNRDGIYRFRFEEKQGTLREAGKEDSFPAVALAVWERGRILYAVSQEQEGSRIRSYSIQPDGSLTRRAEKEYGFSGVSYVRASEDGRLLWIAAYGCGAVAAVSLQDGRPGEAAAWKAFPGSGINPKRQEFSHPHFILEREEGLFVPDLGTDQIHRLTPVWRQGKLTLVCCGNTELPAGSGPRHMAYNPENGEYYLVTELGNEIFRYVWDGRKKELVCRQRQSLLAGWGKGENLAADVRVFGKGSRVLASERGENTIQIFEVDKENGTLTLIRRIHTDGWPRNVRADGTGGWIFAANEEYGNSRGSLEVFGEDGNCSCRIPLKGAYAMETFFEEGEGV